MRPLLHARSLLRASRTILSPNGPSSAFCNVRRRGFADVADNDMALPLKGYKVLDMTRVLAGVSYLYIEIDWGMLIGICSHIAHKSSVI